MKDFEGTFILVIFTCYKNEKQTTRTKNKWKQTKEGCQEKVFGDCVAGKQASRPANKHTRNIYSLMQSGFLPCNDVRSEHILTDQFHELPYLKPFCATSRKPSI